tara:strand:- start:170 stop:454 length:285 start_codon:yes stop_codon:yes gene_type:complete
MQTFATLINVVMTIVLGGAILYLLNRIRSMEKVVDRLRADVRHAANLDDVVDLTQSLVADAVQATKKEDGEIEEEEEEADEEADGDSDSSRSEN